MDMETISTLGDLLTGNIGHQTRSTTCATIAACTSGESAVGLRAQIGTTTAGETLIRRLLTLTSEPTCARFSLSALINLSEDTDAAATMTRAAAVERCASSLLDEECQQLAPLFAGLLSNLTRFPAGVDALVGKGKGTSATGMSVNTLLKLVTRIDTIPNVLWMSNTCSTAEGRAVLLIPTAGADVERQPLTWLLRLLTSSDETHRLAAASALRNCSMAEDCHETLVQGTNALGICLSRLMTSAGRISLQDVEDAPHEVRAIAADRSMARPEPLAEIRLLLVESLLLLCKTMCGRTALREKDAYLVLHEWAAGEDNEEIKLALASTMQRIMTQEDDAVDGAVADGIGTVRDSAETGGDTVAIR